MSLRYVAGISWPRSGHHLLARLLQMYFGERFKYCEFYTPSDCCKHFPCKNSNVNFSKNHDHDLSLPVDLSISYLVQYRAFVPAIVSEFELYLRLGRPDTKESFRRFAFRRTKKYARFVHKWAHPNKKGRMVLRYEDLVSDPIGNIREVVHFFSPHERIDGTAVERAVRTIDAVQATKERDIVLSAQGVHGPRDIRRFRYYDPALFEELREQASE